MASITIRQLDDSIKKSLRLLAAKNERSMEAQARIIFTEYFSKQDKEEKGLASSIQEIMQTHTVDIEDSPLPNRQSKSSHRFLDFSDKTYE